jgi:hypothetical protein
MAATQTISVPSAVLQFPQVPADQISQQELSEFIGARRTLEKLQKHVDRLEEGILARVRAGVEIEPVRLCVEAKRSTRRSPSWKEIVKRLAGRLGMDGDAYCSNVISHTKRSESFSLGITSLVLLTVALALSGAFAKTASCQTQDHRPVLKSVHLLKIELPSLAASESFDYATTAAVISRTVVERNPILGPHPGPARLSAFGAAELGMWTWTLSRTERSSSPFVRWGGRAALVGQIAVHVRLGFGNLQIGNEPPHLRPIRTRRYSEAP